MSDRSDAGRPIPADLAAEVAPRLLAFYDERRRDLPWRRAADPYRVWVSEVMLQQTRVEAAVPYYERWLRRFPTLDALADAPLDDVLKHWEGLGYYARARNLHRAARVIRERHAGAVPSDPESLRRLPGVGEYTAGAIASIAFGVPAPAVDGNVRRVLSRLLDRPDPTAAELRRAAARLIPDDRPGDFNQALMELGATVCTPRSPACGTCPLAGCCLARGRGTQAERPRPKPRPAIPEYDVGAAVVIATGGRLLLARRPENGLLGGLWEFPATGVAPDEAPAAAAARAAREALRRAENAGAGDAYRAAHPAGATRALAGGLALGAIVHAFSHRRVTYHAYRFDLPGDPGDPGIRSAVPPADLAWVAPAELDAFALPTAQRKIMALALGRAASALAAKRRSSP